MSLLISKIISSIVQIIVFSLTGTIGWFMGYTNAKKAEGSILPSWCIHSIANIFSGLCSAFVLIA